MFALAVDLLAGRYVATAYNDRSQGEWPPHPARLFSALVATWAEAGDDPAEARVLDWLAAAPAPDVIASGTSDVTHRTVVPVFVPVNDIAISMSPRASAADLEAAVRLLPEHRTRQARTFPSITPAATTVAYVWPATSIPADLAGAMSAMLARLVRLGHSSSFVRVTTVGLEGVAALEARATRYVPDPDEGELMLRWVSSDQRALLAEAFERHHETEPRVLPATFVRYREGAAPPEHLEPVSVFGSDWLVFARVGGPRLPLVSTAGLARQFRRALMAAADKPVAEIISGHRPDGSASELPHVAVVPLPNVATRHADGSLLGIALVLPRSTTAEERRAVMAAVTRLEAAANDGAEEAAAIPVRLGDAGVLELERVVWGEHASDTLRGGTWSRAARRWATATPVALDRNPGDLHDADPVKRAEAFVAATSGVVQSLERIGLPAPERVDVVRSVVLPGSAKPRTFPRFPPDAGRPQRVLVHARVEFAEPVRGPILAGAGRYLGLGLFRPIACGAEVRP